MSQQAQILLTHELGALDLASMTTVDLVRLGTSAREHEDRATVQAITKELQRRYHAGTLNAEYNDPVAGQIIAEQRNQIADLTARLEVVNGELLACRSSCDELRPQPDWSTAPPGYDWWQYDDNWHCFWHRNKPILNKGLGCWQDADDSCIRDTSQKSAEWESSLHQRPST